MKRLSALLVILFVAVLAFAQNNNGSVTVTQSSAISDAVNNGGKPAKQQGATTQQKQQANNNSQQTTQKQTNTTNEPAKSSASSGEPTSSSNESESSDEPAKKKTTTSKPHTYSNQPAKKQAAPAVAPGLIEEERIAAHTRERQVDYSTKGKKIMKGAHKIKGYRLQIYNGGNKGVDKKKAQEAAEKVKKQYPNMPVYVHFYSPRWMTMCGNYRTHKEAEEAQKKLINAGFKKASIVRQEVIVD